MVVIPSWLAKIVCPKQVDDVCPFRSTDIVRRLEKIEQDGQQRADALRDLTKALHDHIRQETSDFGAILSEVRELVSGLKATHG